MDTFRTQERVAIQLHTETTKYMLVRHTQNDEPLFSVQFLAIDEEPVRTKDWNEPDDEDSESILLYVSENLRTEIGQRSA